MDEIFSNTFFISILTGYLFGSIPTAYWLGLSIYRINIFEHGSKNMGATNVHRVLGRGPFFFTLVIDIGKGILAVLSAAYFAHPVPNPVFVKLLAGFSAVFGHTFSFWVKFRGGKGVATGLGVFLALTPWSSILSLIVFLIVLVVSGFVSLGSITASACLPLFIYFSKEGGEEWRGYLAIFAGIIAAIIIYKHKANIGRIIRGEELSLRASPSPKPSSDLNL